MQRGWMDDDIFQSPRREPFCHRAAWIWMIERAAFRSGTVRFNGHEHAVDRGQFVSSLQDMGSSWGWNATKVARFLTVLRDRGLIVTASVTSATSVTICFYDKYQGVENLTVTPSEARPLLTVKRDRYGYKKQENQGKEENPSEAYASSGVSDARERAGTVPEPKPPPQAKPSQADLVKEFETVWKLYPRRVSKGAALKVWFKARTIVDLETITLAVRRYAERRRGEDPQYTKHFSSWLHQQCWLDEPDVEKQHDQYRERRDLFGADKNQRELDERQRAKQLVRTTLLAGGMEGSRTDPGTDRGSSPIIEHLPASSDTGDGGSYYRYTGTRH